jgi:hypothetical protein
MADKKNRYIQIIESIFKQHYREGATEFSFARIEIEETASILGIALPMNLGDILYTFRYRSVLPASITESAPDGFEWIIRPAGRGLYKFVLARRVTIVPSDTLVETKIPDATPGVISMYALSDEQALLAKIRYNRLIDIFTGLTCYSLQNHLRTTAPDIGQVEIDEIYIGLDKRGAHYVLPVQAKGGADRIGVIQIEQDLAVCAAKFERLICRPVAAQFIDESLIALFELEPTNKGLRVSAEKHYKLVPPDDLKDEDLTRYKKRQD